MVSPLVKKKKRKQEKEIKKDTNQYENKSSSHKSP